MKYSSSRVVPIGNFLQETSPQLSGQSEIEHFDTSRDLTYLDGHCKVVKT